MQKRVVRFEIQDMLPIGLTLVVAGIGLAYGLSVMGDIKSGMCTGSLEHWSGNDCYTCPNSTWNTMVAPGACSNQSQGDGMPTNFSVNSGGSAQINASTDAIRGVAKIPEKMPLIATVIVAAIIIGVLVRYLMVRFA